MKKDFQPLTLVFECRYCRNEYKRVLRLTDELLEDKEGLGNFLSWQSEESLKEMKDCPKCKMNKEIKDEDDLKMERVLKGEDAGHVFGGYKIQSFLSISVRYLNKKLSSKVSSMEKQVEYLEGRIKSLERRGREL